MSKLQWLATIGFGGTKVPPGKLKACATPERQSQMSKLQWPAAAGFGGTKVPPGG